jgi:hypothetical protein
MFENIMGVLNFGDPIGLLFNLIISTVAGGLIFMAVVKILEVKLGDNVGLMRPFLVVFVINIINMLGIIGIIMPFLDALPYVKLIIIVLPALIWIMLTKVLIPDMNITHALLIGIIGYALSIFFFPIITVALAAAVLG